MKCIHLDPTLLFWKEILQTYCTGHETHVQTCTFRIIKGPQSTLILFLSLEDTRRRWPPATQRRSPLRTSLSWHLDLGPPASRTLRNVLFCLSCRPAAFCCSSPSRLRHWVRPTGPLPGATYQNPALILTQVVPGPSLSSGTLSIRILQELEAPVGTGQGGGCGDGFHG